MKSTAGLHHRKSVLLFFYFGPVKSPGKICYNQFCGTILYQRSSAVITLCWAAFCLSAKTHAPIFAYRQGNEKLCRSKGAGAFRVRLRATHFLFKGRHMRPDLSPGMVSPQGSGIYGAAEPAGLTGSCPPPDGEMQELLFVVSGFFAVTFVKFK